MREVFRSLDDSSVLSRWLLAVIRVSTEVAFDKHVTIDGKKEFGRWLKALGEQMIATAEAQQ